MPVRTAAGLTTGPAAIYETETAMKQVILTEPRTLRGRPYRPGDVIGTIDLLDGLTVGEVTALLNIGAATLEAADGGGQQNTQQRQKRRVTTRS